MCPSRLRQAATRKGKPVLRAALRRTGFQCWVETEKQCFPVRPSMHLENLPALSGGRCGAFLSTTAVHVGIDSTIEAPRGVNYEEAAACRNLRVCIWTVLLGGRRQVAAGHRNPPTPRVRRAGALAGVTVPSSGVPGISQGAAARPVPIGNNRVWGAPGTSWDRRWVKCENAALVEARASFSGFPGTAVGLKRTSETLPEAPPGTPWTASGVSVPSRVAFGTPWDPLGAHPGLHFEFPRAFLGSILGDFLCSRAF